MTHALILIKEFLKKEEFDFKVPAKYLQEPDLQLLECGALRFKGDYLDKVACPDCGNIVQVDAAVDSSGELAYTILCPYCECWEDKEIPCQEVDLLDFNFRAFKFFVEDREAYGAYVDEAAKCLPFEIEKLTPDQRPVEIKPKESVRFTKTIGRFKVTKDGTSIKLDDPHKRYEKFNPYYGIDKPSAAFEAISTLLNAYAKKSSEGWCRSATSWHTAFPAHRYPYVYRFKSQQIEVGDRSNGHVGEWRIVPDDAFDERYCRWIGENLSF